MLGPLRPQTFEAAVSKTLVADTVIHEVDMLQQSMNIEPSTHMFV